MILWRCGGKGWLNQSVNELINDEAVFRTAPATPGLLKGPRDLNKYKSSEWLLKLVAICLSFGFCKTILKFLNLQIGTKKN